MKIDGLRHVPELFRSCTGAPRSTSKERNKHPKPKIDMVWTLGKPKKCVKQKRLRQLFPVFGPNFVLLLSYY